MYSYQSKQNLVLSLFIITILDFVSRFEKIVTRAGEKISVRKIGKKEAKKNENNFEEEYVSFSFNFTTSKNIPTGLLIVPGGLGKMFLKK